MPVMKRRELISILPLTTLIKGAENEEPAHVAANVYPWMTFAKRAGEKFEKHSDWLLGEISGAGIGGYEPIIEGVNEFKVLGAKLKKHHLEMKSLYVNSTLHEAAAVEKSSLEVLAIAREARKLGTKIIVTNPSPIKWGGDEAKSDAQLRIQVTALEELGLALKKEGIVLAYHNHDAELRNGAREFHHMLAGTSAEAVSFCLDAHWIYRGCGNSEVAVFDVVKNYGDRIVELHLRQSVEGIWTEAFAMEGDLDYRRLFDVLKNRGMKPHLVLEQAVEEKSSKTMQAPEAHLLGRKALEV